MATPIEMPKLGNTVEDCLLARWNKRRGDSVAAGELIAEIETDKATFEIVAPVAGTVLETFISEGELAPVFTNICVIGEPGEDAEPFRPKAGATPAEPVAAAERPQPAAGATALERPAPAHEAAPAAAETHLSPRARRFAGEHDFHPGVVTGSGPGGRVLEADLRNLYMAAPRRSALAAEYLRQGYEIQGEGSGINHMILAGDLSEPPVKISSVRERIARRMRESLATTAQYTLNASAGAAGLLSLRARVKAARQSRAMADVNIGDMIMFCAVKALLDVPELNVEFTGGKLYRRSSIHIGFACDTPKGLLVPVVKDSQKLGLEELSQRIKALAQQAMDGVLPPDDMAGGTFTVSNLGSYGIESFTPILNPPQVAILGVDAIGLKPVRRNGAVEFVDMIGLSLTLDHQVIDGAPGARFLKVVREKIEAVEALCGLEL